MNGSQFAIVIGIVAAVVVGMAGCAVGCGEGYSDGTRTGTITKFSRKGIVWKSYEGEMNLGGMRSTTDGNGAPSVVPNVWQFHAADALAAKVEEAQRSGKPVSIHYRQWIVSPVTQDYDYDVVSVTVEP